MTVGELLRGQIVSASLSSQSLSSQEVSGLQYDSRKLQPGELFFAFEGENVDGHRFIESALKAGAAGIVSEREPPNETGRKDLQDRWVRVQHGREALAKAALRFCQRPDQRLKLTGVTGTNGKTTAVFLIDSVLRGAGFTTARIGTVDHMVGEKSAAAVNTTPESLDLVRYFAELEAIKGTHATLEVSSHALALRRVYGFDFHTVVFTNLSRDHLDFHSTMESYAAAKKRLFEGAGGATPRCAVINRDDAFGKELSEMGGFETLTYGRSKAAAVRAAKVEATTDSLRFQVSAPSGSCEIAARLRGAYNVPNMLAAIGTGLSYGLDLRTVAAGIEDCPPIPGRFETVECGQPFLVVVDYAHTDDALENLIRAARDLPRQGKQPSGVLTGRALTCRVLTMFGCGGDRDRAKRPVMGEIAGRLSDLVILTSDNPRSEDPLNIMNDILVGLKRVDGRFLLEPDRAEAIAKTLKEARKGDIVLLAGKGHETRQTIGQDKIPFDDRVVAREVLRGMGYG